MDLGEQAHRVKFMIRDRGPDFTTAFDAVLADAGIRTVLCNVAKADPHRLPDQRVPPGRMTWTRFSARTTRSCVCPRFSACSAVSPSSTLTLSPLGS
jgi:hypothetical protein